MTTGLPADTPAPAGWRLPDRRRRAGRGAAHRLRNAADHRGQLRRRRGRASAPEAGAHHRSAGIGRRRWRTRRDGAHARRGVRHDRVLDLLVRAGAEPHGIQSAAAVGDIAGWLTPDTPLQARIRALTFAADHQRLSVIDQLIEAQTPVDAVDELHGRQALRLAAQDGRPESVRRLLEHGADPNRRTSTVAPL